MLSHPPATDGAHRAVPAGVLALIGKKDMDQAEPPLPTDALESVQADVAAVLESAR